MTELELSRLHCTIYTYNMATAALNTDKNNTAQDVLIDQK